MNEHHHFRVGIMTVVLNEKGQVLLGKRKNAFAAGEYGIPSGHMEKGETFLAAASREIEEEIGIGVSQEDLILFAISNYIIEEWTDQYITFDFLLKISSDATLVCEQEKCEGWDWYDLDKLPAPLHYPAQRAIEQYLQYVVAQSLIIS
jgi:8-oxo-dGTP diphosphatase